MNKNLVTIYTDGACAGNPGPGGYGAYLTYGSYERRIYGYDLHTTNNRMEILSVIKALELLKYSCVIDLYTDSKYVKDAITKWIFAWVKNNWKTSNKSDVKNVDLWKMLQEQVQRHEITWHWVKGHSGNVGNEIADALAIKRKEEAILLLKQQNEKRL